MNVNYIHGDLNEIFFKNAEVGACFIFDDEAWMKIDPVAEGAHDGAGWYNAIHLETGEPIYFPASYIIIVPKSTTLKVEY